MQNRLREALNERGGVATWAHLTAQVPPHSIKSAVASGSLIRILPRVYTSVVGTRDRSIQLQAALLFAGTGSALCHTTALQQWPRLHLPHDGRVHIATPNDRDRRSIGFVVVHKRNLRSLEEIVRPRHGMPAVVPTVSLVDAWTILPVRERRAPVIDAVRIGLAVPQQIAAIVQDRKSLRGRAELLELLAMLAAGCRSELEILGLRKIFNRSGLPRAQWQFPVEVDDRNYVLDAAWPDLLLALELDGARYHSRDDARERDVRRDSDLARIGWLTIRITYDRLVQDAAGVVAELRDVIAIRARQLGAAS